MESVQYFPQVLEKDESEKQSSLLVKIHFKTQNNLQYVATRHFTSYNQ